MSKAHRRGIATAALTALTLAGAITAPVAHAASAPSKLSPGFTALLSSSPPAAPVQAIVQFTSGNDATQSTLLASRGITVLDHLAAIDAAIVRGPLAAIGGLAKDTRVRYVEPDTALELHGDTSGWATRVEVTRHAVAGGPFTTAGGDAIDGTGVGVAVVDSGADGTHPDLDLTSNWLEQVGLRIDVGPDQSSDIHSGHGTHVSGILAGDGTASDGTYTGVAPGVSLNVFSSGVLISAAFAAESFDHIASEFASFSPTIRVLNFSVGNPGGSPWDVNGVIEQLMVQLVGKGVTIVVSAGNNGGDGTTDTTSGYCKAPVAGIICVTNYDDADSGRRDGVLDVQSSRGDQADPATWPDLSAPGAFITSACAVTTGVLCDSVAYVTPSPSWPGYYGIASGTSMSAPHVSGIAALLLQVDPSLTPADVEAILEASALDLPLGPWEDGAGLVDAPAALLAAGAVATGAATPAAVVTDATGDFVGSGDADVVSLDVDPAGAGVTYRLALADLDDQALLVASYRIFQTVDGVDRLIDLDATTASVAGAATTFPVTRDGNTLVLTVPDSALGAPGAIAYTVQVASYLRLVVDVAPNPSTDPQLGLDLSIRPVYGAPYVI